MCARTARRSPPRRARSRSTDAALAAFEAAPAATLDPQLHYVEGSPEDVARYMLTLDTINFGSGWFPTLRKRPGHSGYATIAAALAERFRAEGPWSNAQLRALETRDGRGDARPGRPTTS